MLTLTNVHKEYEDFTLDCSIELMPGRITGLIGRNGAGKSTVFKVALGLVGTDGGEVTVFGKPVEMLTTQDRQQSATKESKKPILTFRDQSHKHNEKGVFCEA